MADSGAEILKGMISAVEDEMLARLEQARGAFAHAGDKGATVEEAMRTTLRKYLPAVIRVGQGEVIDTAARRSGQTDVLIASPEHPFTFPVDGPGLFLIEGVVAAGEVKSVLTSKELESALNASTKFKALEARMSGRAKTTDADVARFYV